MLIGTNPIAARSTFLAQGRAAARHRDYDQAIADLTQAIAQDPSDKSAYEARGLCYLRQKEKKYDLARADFDAIIRLDPRNGRAFSLRGLTYLRQYQYAQASADFEQSIALNPDDAQAYNSAAWLMATCPDSKIRNGPKAIEFATKGCEFSSWRLPSLIDTLAAAYANEGKFDDAVKWENQAIEIWSSRWRNVDALLKAARERLELYKAGKPYRETGVGP
jgi:tetratricopeptide (TPR) repeat protein